VNSDVQYFEAVSDLLDIGGLAVNRTCVGRCPECGETVENMDGDAALEHRIWAGILTTELAADEDWLTELGATVVVVGCEGYWTIDPALVGMPRPSWQPSDSTEWFEVDGAWVTADLSLAVTVEDDKTWTLRDLSAATPEEVASFSTPQAAIEWVADWDRAA